MQIQKLPLIFFIAYSFGVNEMESKSLPNNVSEIPGTGWSNGDFSSQLFPTTQAGKIELFSKQRRWIGLQSGWTRIGDGTTELDASHCSSSGTGDLLAISDDDQARAVRCLISQLSEKFYGVGWATGTSGGISIRIRSNEKKTNNDDIWRVFVTPSGIQKEDMIGDDIYELDINGSVVVPPKTPGLRQSACTSLWYVIYKARPNATCAIHTHSMNAVQATLLDTTEQSDCLRLTYLEMLKGVGNHAYDDVLEIPIIDNKPTEDLLADDMAKALHRYPKSNAVLVRRHGLFVWGDSWEQAKTQCESFDYLFDCAIKMKMMGIDPSIAPSKNNNGAKIKMDESKKRKLENSFNGVSASGNFADVESNPTPILPRDRDQYEAVVLDIEGCTTSISFVTETLFPYVRKNLKLYCTTILSPEDYIQYLDSLKKEIFGLPDDPSRNEAAINDAQTIDPLVNYLMDRDVKSAALKDLQGKMWKQGYASGELKGHVYPDTTAMLRWMKMNNIPVYIYSSGSINAQKLLFGNSDDGDLLPNVAGHFDITTAGPKKEAASYSKIATTLNIDISKIVFVSDSEDELYAAREAGLGAPIMSIRSGNAPISSNGKKDFSPIYSLLQLCG